MVTSTITSATYGRPIPSKDDEYFIMAQMAMEGIDKAVIPGVHWVDYFPILRHVPSWVPGAAAQKLAKFYRPYLKVLREMPFLGVKEDMVRL